MPALQRIAQTCLRKLQHWYEPHYDELSATADAAQVTLIDLYLAAQMTDLCDCLLLPREQRRDDR